MIAAALIRGTRQSAGLSLRALAERANTSHATLAAYESGRVVPRVDTLARIVAAAGFALDPTVVRRQRLGSSGGSRGDEILRVIGLAGLFPIRRKPTLDLPPFRRQ